MFEWAETALRVFFALAVITIIALVISLAGNLYKLKGRVKNPNPGAIECIAKYRKVGVCKAISKCNARVPKSCYRMVD